MLKICFVMPTYRSRSYFNRSFKELEKAVWPVAMKYDATVLVVLNGSDEEDREQVEATLSECRLQTELIVTELPGQNNATNTGLDYCRRHGFEIMQAVDDDQFYGPQTLLSNVETLERVSVNRSQFCLFETGAWLGERRVS